MSKLSADRIRTALQESTTSIRRCPCLNNTKISMTAFEAELIKQGATKAEAKKIAAGLDVMDGPKADGEFFAWKLANKDAGGDSSGYVDATGDEDKATWLQSSDEDRVLCNIAQELYKMNINKAFIVDTKACGVTALENYKSGQVAYQNFKDEYLKITKRTDSYSKEIFESSGTIADDLYKMTGLQKPEYFETSMGFDELSSQVLIGGYRRSPFQESGWGFQSEKAKAYGKQLMDFVDKLKEKFGAKNVKAFDGAKELTRKEVEEEGQTHISIVLDKSVMPMILAELRKLKATP